MQHLEQPRRIAVTRCHVQGKSRIGIFSVPQMLRAFFATPTAFVVVFILFAAASTTNAQTRHALVIGIDDYAHVSPLQKARNDAEAVSAALDRLGFVVMTEIDPDRRRMNEALSSFSSQLEPGDEALFYFAGHGVEVAGRNYLLPADIPVARPGDEDFVTAEAIPVDRVLNIIQRRGARVSLLILDACRDNPFPIEGARSLGRSRGLARVDPPEGAFILFSAGTGQAALDRLSDSDPDPNSVFTRALLPRLQEPGLDIHSLARDVRRDVRALARQVNHDQFPAYYDQLAGNFSFNPQATVDVDPTLTLQSPQTSTVVDCEAARRDWALIETINTLKVVDAFITQYEHCPLMVAVAKLQREELSASADDARPPPVSSPSTIAPTITAGIPHEVLRDVRISSYWDHNGSRMGLIASGNSRQFVYVEPRTGIMRRGVEPGTLLFDGRRDRQQYIGTARIFARPHCGVYKYNVSGPIAPDDRGITLHGQAPLVDEHCRVTGYRDYKLVFTLQ